MRDEALVASRPTPGPETKLQTSHELFAAILLRRPRDPLDAETSAIVAWARTETSRWIAAGRASSDAVDWLAFRFLYRALRERAIAADPDVQAPTGPRWEKALWAACGLRHRQRATLALYYCASLPLDDVARVVGVGAAEARKVLESAVTQVVRAVGGPLDVRRSLRIAAARCTASTPRSVITLPDTEPVVRLPRSVVRTWTTSPSMKRWITAPLSSGLLHDRLVEAGHRFPEPRVEPIPRTARRSPIETLLAQVEQAPADMGPPVEEPTPVVVAAVEPAMASAPAADIVPLARTAVRPPRSESVARRVAFAVAAALIVVGVLVPGSARDTTIPPPAPPREPAKTVSTVAPVPTDTHVLGRAFVRVEPGDTLWQIAERELGDGFRWHALWRLNRGRSMAAGERFNDPGLIRPSWRLRLPRDRR